METSAPNGEQGIPEDKVRGERDHDDASAAEEGHAGLEDLGQLEEEFLEVRELGNQGKAVEDGEANLILL